MCCLNKVDSSLPISQFSYNRYDSPYCLDVSNRRGGLLVYVNASVPTWQLKYKSKYKDIRIIHFEINLKKEK